MRLRWITALSALALKVLLIGAVLVLGRVVLFRNYANLEREDAEGTLNQVCVILQSQLQDLDIITHDYAAWDSTYRFVKHPNAEYVRADISETTFQTRHMHLYLLLDSHFKVILAKTFNENSRASLAADVEQLVRAVKRRARPDASVFGLLSLTAGPAMVSIRPVLTTLETGPSPGTLIIVRDLGPQDMDALSRLAAVPVTISGTTDDSEELATNSRLRRSPMTTVAIDENRLVASAMLNDLWRQPRIRLQISENRAIWREGQKTIRDLVIGLVIVGLLFAVVNAWVMQRLVVRRVERLIRLTSDTETEAGLNARVHISGSDELAQLGHRMNKMLERLQNSNDALLSVQERLRYEATHDNLTGIWNRGAAMRLLDQELARSSREGSVVSVILFDADHFKDINDTYGHSTGDRALQTIASAITRNLRNSDVCCRYGGEEFLVIAPNCNQENATQLAQRILDYLRATTVSVLEHSFRVTLSAGVTACTPGCKAEDLIMVADRALYRAKELGRDRVETETLPTGTAARNQRFAPSGLPQPT